MKKLLLFTVLTLFCFNAIAQQKITPPSEGKAVIYFLRTKSLGAMMNFRFFDKDNFIGKIHGKNYIRYECNSGEGMFWVKSENIDFIETNLDANKIYLVEVNAVMGAFSAGVKFRLVDYSDDKQMRRIYKLLNEKEEKVFTEEELQDKQKEMINIIESGLLKVQKKIKKGKKIKRITPDMYFQVGSI